MDVWSTHTDTANVRRLRLRLGEPPVLHTILDDRDGKVQFKSYSFDSEKASHSPHPPPQWISCISLEGGVENTTDTSVQLRIG